MADDQSAIRRFLYFLAGVYIVQLVLAFGFIPQPLSLEEFALIITAVLAMFGYFVSIDHRLTDKLYAMETHISSNSEKIEHLVSTVDILVKRKR